MRDIERLIPLERAAEEERAKLAGLRGADYEEQWRAWRRAFDAVETAVTEHATTYGKNRHEVEDAVKRAIRRTDEDPCE
ncbi:hypothetical protein [Streptomyces sp. NPDC059466]|uniref:hypothetical protein n=1 Tax=unclassified Streptomyces TaxID=2593676 RepID=UPI0036B5ADB7